MFLSRHLDTATETMSNVLLVLLTVPYGLGVFLGMAFLVRHWLV